MSGGARHGGGTPAGAGVVEGIPGMGAADPGSGARSAALMILSSGAQLVIGVAAVAVLARLLTPADFGVFTMAAVVVGFVGAFRDFGLPMATVQTAGLQHEQASALFWLNLKLSAALALLVAAAGPLLAWFFGHPALVGITAALAAGLGFAAVTNIHQGLLARGMRFGAVTAMEVTAAACGAAAGIAAALLGARYWALVIQQVCFFAVQGSLPWLVCRWRPSSFRRPNDAAALRDLVFYGREVTLSKVVTQLGSNLDFVLIGRFAGAGQLGLYQAAFRWATLPIQQLYTPLNGVVVATLSRRRSDPTGFRAGFRAAVGGCAALAVPALVFVFVAAPDVVLLLLGPQWLGAVPLLRALSAAALFDIGRLSCKWSYLAEGRTAKQLRWTLIASATLAVGVSVGMLWGAGGVAIGVAVSTGVLLVPGVAYCVSDSPLRARDFWLPVWRPVAAAVVAGALLAAAREWAALPLPLLAALPLQGLLFLLLYAGAWLAMPGGRREARGMARRLRSLARRPSSGAQPV